MAFTDFTVFVEDWGAFLTAYGLVLLMCMVMIPLFQRAPKRCRECVLDTWEGLRNIEPNRDLD